MIDFQGVLLVLETTVDKAAKSRWFRWVPRFKVDRYPGRPDGDNTVWAWVLGIEPTRARGWGVGLGLGTIDLWFGWPKIEESLHYKGCVHNKVEETVCG